MARSLKDILSGKNTSKKEKGDVGGLAYPHDGDDEMVKDHEVEVHADRAGNGDDVYKSSKKHATRKPDQNGEGKTVGIKGSFSGAATSAENKVKKVDEGAKSNPKVKAIMDYHEKETKAKSASSWDHVKSDRKGFAKRTPEQQAHNDAAHKDSAQSYYHLIMQKRAQKAYYHGKNDDAAFMSQHAKRAKASIPEEAEQIDEISSKLAREYANAASDDVQKNKFKMSDRKLNNRLDGVFTARNKADNRRSNVKVVTKDPKEEVEVIDELSKDTLKRYKLRAEVSRDVRDQMVDKKVAKAADAKTASTKAFWMKRANANAAVVNKRSKGITMANDKLTKEETEINELSTDKLKTYKDKAEVSYTDNASVARQTASLKDIYAKSGDAKKAAAADRVEGKLRAKAEKRFAGIKTARKKIKEKE